MPSVAIHTRTVELTIPLALRFEISRNFALVGCRVIMVNRKEEQGREAIDKIRSEKPDALVEWLPCDLGNLGEVREVFAGIAGREQRLDLVRRRRCRERWFGQRLMTSPNRSSSARPASTPTATAKTPAGNSQPHSMPTRIRARPAANAPPPPNRIDRHFGVNWLGHFYAVNLLYPLLRKTSKLADAPAPRIVMESSEITG